MADEATAEGVSIHASVVRAGFLVIASEYEKAIEFVGAQSPDDDWEEGILLLFRAHSERALGRLTEAAATVAEARKILGSDQLGAQQWETAMLHLQEGDIDAAIAAFEMLFTEDGRLVDAYAKLNSAV